MGSTDFELRVLRFEQACQLPSPGGIAESLDEPPALSAFERSRLLVELICIDLEVTD